MLKLDGGEKGPAFGAAHLARMALTEEAASDVCVKPAVIAEFAPEPEIAAAYRERVGDFRHLYRTLKAAR